MWIPVCCRIISYNFVCVGGLKALLNKLFCIGSASLEATCGNGHFVAACLVLFWVG